MHWPDFTRNPPERTLRQFAASCLVFGPLVGAWLLWRGSPWAAGAILIAAIGLGARGLASPRTLRWPYVVAMLLTFPIGWIVSHVILAAIYFGLIMPLGLLLRLFGHKPLEMKPDPGRETYWQPRETPPEPKSHLRQY